MNLVLDKDGRRIKTSTSLFPRYISSLATLTLNRPTSYSGKESESNDVMMQFEEFSNVHNSDRAFNTTRSNLADRIV